MVHTEEIRNKLFGFLSVVDVEGLGYCGGLLVLNDRGRPVEFHCTTPVNPSRAQTILYGETLKEFLFCDQIGTALIQKVKAKLELILVDDSGNLALSQLNAAPVVLVVSNDQQEAETGQFEILRTVDDSQLEIDGHRLEVRGGDLNTVSDLVTQFIENLPLAEPFERIRLAISEAHSEAA